MRFRVEVGLRRPILWRDRLGCVHVPILLTWINRAYGSIYVSHSGGAFWRRTCRPIFVCCTRRGWIYALLLFLKLSLYQNLVTLTLKTSMLHLFSSLIAFWKIDGVGRWLVSFFEASWILFRLCSDGWWLSAVWVMLLHNDCGDANLVLIAQVAAFVVLILWFWTQLFTVIFCAVLLFTLLGKYILFRVHAFRESFYVEVISFFDTCVLFEFELVVFWSMSHRVCSLVRVWRTILGRCDWLLLVVLDCWCCWSCDWLGSCWVTLGEEIGGVEAILGWMH